MEVPLTPTGKIQLIIISHNSLICMEGATTPDIPSPSCF